MNVAFSYMSAATVTGRTTPRTRAAHLGPERRRPLVLDAAKQIAVTDGIPAVTIGAVADRLGVTRPVVYSCFPDRIEMLTALLAREEQMLLAGVLAAYPTPGRYRTSQAAFVGGMQALLRTVAEQPDTWRAIFWSNPGPDVAELFSRARRQVADQFATLVRPDLRRWGTQDLARKLPVLVELFVSVGEGAVRSLLDPGTTYNADELGEIVGRAVYRAIRQA
jgi:AcrR family transcriptional regulator